jgi:hypothetical protein
LFDFGVEEALDLLIGLAQVGRRCGFEHDALVRNEEVDMVRQFFPKIYM